MKSTKNRHMHMKKVFCMHYMGSKMYTPNIYAPQAKNFLAFFRLFLAGSPLSRGGGGSPGDLCRRGGGKGSRGDPLPPSAESTSLCTTLGRPRFYFWAVDLRGGCPLCCEYDCGCTKTRNFAYTCQLTRRPTTDVDPQSIVTAGSECRKTTPISTPAGRNT